MPQVAGPRPHRPGVLLLPPAEVPEFPTQDIALVDLDTVAHASASCLPELAAAAGIATFPPLSRLKPSTDAGYMPAFSLGVPLLMAR